jgi:hypothetical protein
LFATAVEIADEATRIKDDYREKFKVKDKILPRAPEEGIYDVKRKRANRDERDEFNQ